MHSSIHSFPVCGCSVWRWLIVGAIFVFCLIPDRDAAGAEDRTLQDKLRPLIRAHRGDVAIAVRHLKTGVTCGIREQDPQPAAGLIHLAIMIESYRQAASGKIDMTSKSALRPEDRVPGSGVLARHLSDGLALPLRDAVQLMLALDDNTAANMVIDRIGLSSVTSEMKRLGLTQTQLHARFRKPAESSAGGPGARHAAASTTAHEMLRLLDLLQAGKLTTATACDQMLGHLQASEDQSWFRALLPADAVVAELTGAADGVRNAAGLLQTRSGLVALCVLTSGNTDARRTGDNDGNCFCADVARIVFDHFDVDLPDVPESGPVLAQGATGPDVEALQRTLNRRLKLSPELAVDGDFGAATRNAVIRFQKASGLNVTGVADAATRARLGPLVTADDPVPSPEEINAEVLPRAAPDPLNGPPVLTCRAWVAGSARAAQPVGGSDADTRMEIASITKIMTAGVVLRLARTTPDVLNEMVTVSAHAAHVPGSSARLQTGDRLPVHELLFGLMLPSGNDAALALAEHFGPRLRRSDDEGKKQSPAECFVAEMNRTARELGLTRTSYRNPHGLPERGHLSTARDQFLLAAALSRSTALLDYASTRQRGCRIANLSGKSRNNVWKNTNRLLGIEGYVGLKTGTTNAAGSCLVAVGERDGQRLIVVVLGSSSADSRETDVRNLYRWAWNQPSPRP